MIKYNQENSTNITIKKCKDEIFYDKSKLEQLQNVINKIISENKLDNEKKEFFAKEINKIFIDAKFEHIKSDNELQSKISTVINKYNILIDKNIKEINDLITKKELDLNDNKKSNSSLENDYKIITNKHSLPSNINEVKELLTEKVIDFRTKSNAIIKELQNKEISSKDYNKTIKSFESRIIKLQENLKNEIIETVIKLQNRNEENILQEFNNTYEKFINDNNIQTKQKETTNNETLLAKLSNIKMNTTLSKSTKIKKKHAILPIILICLGAGLIALAYLYEDFFWVCLILGILLVICDLGGLILFLFITSILVLFKKDKKYISISSKEIDNLQQDIKLFSDDIKKVSLDYYQNTINEYQLFITKQIENLEHKIKTKLDKNTTLQNEIQFTINYNKECLEWLSAIKKDFNIFITE